MRFRPLFRAATVGFLLLAIGTTGAGAKGESDVLGSLSVADLDGALHQAVEAGAKATVWIFVAHDCPICNSFMPEIGRITADYAPRYVPVHIVYSEPMVPRETILRHSKDYALKNELFADPDCRIAKAFGITATPEAVVMDPEGHIAYRGRIDDRFPTLGVQRPKAEHADLRNALDAVRAGAKVSPAETAPVGCSLEISR